MRKRGNSWTKSGAFEERSGITNGISGVPLPPTRLFSLNQPSSTIIVDAYRTPLQILTPTLRRRCLSRHLGKLLRLCTLLQLRRCPATEIVHGLIWTYFFHWCEVVLMLPKHGKRTLVVTFGFWKLFLLVAAALSPGVGYDTSTSLLLDASTTDAVSARFLDRLVRWDAFYFVPLADYGYIYEQQYAFGWGLSKLIAVLASGTPVMPSRHAARSKSIQRFRLPSAPRCIDQQRPPCC